MSLFCKEKDIGVSRNINDQLFSHQIVWIKGEGG